MKKKGMEILVAASVIIVAFAIWAVKNTQIGGSQNSGNPVNLQVADSAQNATEKSLQELLGIPKGKPVMVDFGSTWCQSCKIMAANMVEAEKILGDKAVIIFIDTDADKEVAMKAGINIIPTQIFFDAQGNEAGRNVGVLTPENIIKYLTEGFPEKS